MLSLFPEEQRYPEGFRYEEEFLSLQEEQLLCDFMSTVPLHEFLFHGYVARRKVMSYGYDYHFTSRTITEGVPVPPQLYPLLEKVSAHLGIPTDDFKEVLLTEYPPGSVINWHRDAPPFDVVVGISLATDCIFRLRPYDKSNQHRSAILSFPVRRRSLYVLSGASRGEWEHSIRPVKQKRYSITLRTLRK
jgi:alkylated DNA repair dioxygenase AlkB